MISFFLLVSRPFADLSDFLGEIQTTDVIYKHKKDAIAESHGGKPNKVRQLYEVYSCAPQIFSSWSWDQTQLCRKCFFFELELSMNSG